MIQSTHRLSKTRRCELLHVSRGFGYYKPRCISEKHKDVIHEMDKIHMDFPEFGSRGIRDTLRLRGMTVSRDVVRKLMRHMGIKAVYCRPRTTVPGERHKIYPYMLKGLEINRSNQVWTTDITYIPMSSGYLYLIAVMDWYSRKVLSWRLSSTMTTDDCRATMQDAITNYGIPEIVNTDQGSQFTSDAFTQLLKDHKIQISMDGKGRWVDNVMVERLWRTLKYGEVYLKDYADGEEARRGISKYIKQYNYQRPHSSIGRVPPARFYYQHLPKERDLNQVA